MKPFAALAAPIAPRARAASAPGATRALAKFALATFALSTFALATLTLGLMATSSAHAAGSASSVASQGGSASLGSSSTSIEQSSQSSTRDNRAAAGRYRIEAVAAVPVQPGLVRLTLAPVDGGEAIALLLPQASYDDSRLGVGDDVRAAPRPYGTEFARADTGRTFFLVLDDAASRDLRTRPVGG